VEVITAGRQRLMMPSDATPAPPQWLHHYLQQVEELKGLHFQAKAAINHQQHQVSHLCSVHHA
jgi:hypothetical protein